MIFAMAVILGYGLGRSGGRKAATIMASTPAGKPGTRRAGPGWRRCERFSAVVGGRRGGARQPGLLTARAVRRVTRVHTGMCLNYHQLLQWFYTLSPNGRMQSQRKQRHGNFCLFVRHYEDRRGQRRPRPAPARFSTSLSTGSVDSSGFVIFYGFSSTGCIAASANQSNSERGNPPAGASASAAIRSATPGTISSSRGTSGLVKPCSARWSSSSRSGRQ